MKIKDIALSAAYVGQRVVKAICVGAQEIWSAVKYIVFADPVVEQICATNWGDGVGITEEQAAKVTNLGSVFKGNTEITSFSELGKFGVTELNVSAFEGCTNLSDVDVSNMTVIGNKAFFGSGLEILDAPNVQSLGAVAFESSKLKAIKNIDSIIDLGSSAFASCSQLISVNLPNNLTKIPNSTFYESVNLRYFNGKDGILEMPNVTNIGYGAFYGVLGLTEVVCPNIKELGASGGAYGAFFNCKNLRSISLPTSVEKIGNNTFSGCSSLEIEDLNVPFLVELGERSFFRTKLKKISNLGSAVTVIGVSTFDECSELTEVDLSSLTNLTTINNSFGTCGKLSKVTLPNSITTLNTYAFINASSLPMINVHSVTTIGNKVFSGCSKLKTFIVENPTPPTLGTNVFDYTPSDLSIYVPDQSVTAYREASGWLNYADKIKPLSEYVES